MIAQGFADLGASFHVSSHGGFFLAFQNGDFGTVKMGNCVIGKIVGIGDITLMTDAGHKLVLKKVRDVPNMCHNHISAWKLDDVWLVNHFGVGKRKLLKGSTIIA